MGTPEGAVPDREAVTAVVAPASTVSNDGAWSEALRLIGGLAAVTVGLIVLLVIAVVSIAILDGSAAQVATVASSAFGVIGTVVGAYFGVKVGTGQTERAMGQTQDVLGALRDESTKAQVFAAHMPADRARDALQDCGLIPPPGPLAAPPPSSAPKEPE